ncbi:MAG: acyltransferase [Beijerinckiaceae bacterium]|nr:acyltransferase [Beijerinckiaceae bacterium]
MIDVARGLAMVIVLYGHALEVLFLERPDATVLAPAFLQYKVLAAFAMPLFFLVSGAGAAKLAGKGWRNVLKTSLFLLALAYFVHALGLLALAVRLGLGGGPDIDLLRYGVESTLKGRDFSTVVVWFLVSLAFVRLIVFAIFRLAPPRLAWAIVAAIGLASLAVPYLPQAFMLRTWFAGTVFFALGMGLAGRFGQASPWLAPALTPVVAWLALANRGCDYDPLSACPQVQLGAESVVWLHAGEVGFIPLFYMTAMLGCALALCVARALAGSVVGPALARIGRKTLELLVINGFVLVFLQPALKHIPLGQAGFWLYPLLLAGVLALHLLLLRLLQSPLSRLQRLASRLADRAIGLWPKAQHRPAAKTPPSGEAVAELSPAER